MKLYVVRHGQTIANRDHIISGHFDTPLSKIGLEQAGALGKVLSNIFFDCIYSSDLQRAVNTAKAVHVYNKNISFVESSLLRERCFGIREGRTNQEVYNSLGLDPLKARSGDMKDEEGYESDEAYVARVEQFFSTNIFPYQDQDLTICIVCHKGTCNIISGLFKGDSHQYLHDRNTRINFKNTAYSIYAYEKNDRRIVKENISDHIDE